LPSAPRTDPSMRNYRTRLLPQVMTQRRTKGPPPVSAQAHWARLPGPESGACFAQTDSPWPTPFPPPPPQLALCSAASSVLWSCPTSHDRSSSAYVLGLPDAASIPLRTKAVMGSPDSRSRCFRACPGSTTAQGPCASRVIDAHRVAFRYVHSVGTLEQEPFHGSIAGPHVPLSTLR